MTKGEKLLKAFGQPIDITYKQFFIKHKKNYEVGEFI
jgi:hypothetical protein